VTLRLAGVSYTYAGASAPALTDVGFELSPGEVFGVAGASESGKSTLCLVASGLAPAVIGGRLNGSVFVDNLDTSDAPPHELAQRCGILFQHPATQISGKVIDRTWNALSAVAIDDLAERDPSLLSGGQLQLVALAAVLAMRPPYLILDEPTAQLDPAGTDLVGRAISSLVRAGAGVLLVEQKTDLLAQLADRVAIVVAGSLVAQGPPAQVFGAAPADAWLVELPARARLARRLSEAGLQADLPQ
jgi:energy-coupling factor transporter ATP-binding protein EcfA2